MKRKSFVAVACVLSCLTSAALAQTSVDRSFKAVSKDCSGVQWSQQSLRNYPTIGSACQGVEERNGKTYVKFSGTLKSNDRGKQLTIDFKDGGLITLSPPPETKLYVNGKATPVADLQRGTDLTFYIAEDRLAAQFPEQDSGATTRYVMVPILVHEQPEQVAASLPATASSLPLVAMYGLMMLGLGAVLTLRRHRR